MKPGAFTKRYGSRSDRKIAEARYRWLAGLDSGVRLPALLDSSETELVFEHLGAHRLRPDHLDLMATAIGRLHAAAYMRTLHGAELTAPHDAGPVVIPDFVSPRRAALAQGPGLDYRGPAAFYKDANIRNFALVDGGVAILDFDDLTLAPFGYDLAKLVISAFMTHGQLGKRCISSMLTAYNEQVAHLADNSVCSLDQLLTYVEIHHLLTERYLGHNGYRFLWPDVRPPRSARPRADAGA